MISDLLYRLTLAGGDPDFLSTVLATPCLRGQIERSIRTDAGQTLKLRGDDIVNLVVPDVPYEVQVEALGDLARHTTRVRSATEALLRQITLLQERRQALITAAVIGELHIAGAA